MTPLKWMQVSHYNMYQAKEFCSKQHLPASPLSYYFNYYRHMHIWKPIPSSNQHDTTWMAIWAEWNSSLLFWKS